jgi:protein-S-isoprenylcysteine O-methyltransferase Ste14
MGLGRLIVATSPTAHLVHVGNAACWGAFVVVWIAAAAHDRPRAPRRRTLRTDGWGLRIAAIVPCAVLVVLVRLYAGGLTVDVVWLRIVGLVVLVASTAFAFWARFALGTMWSLDAVVKEHHELRTHGPYAVTRNPIYTGLLGMLLGSTLLSGFGRWIFLVPLGLVVLGLKARQEERLMASTFPDQYPGYRRQVPALVPRLRRSERRRSPRP